MFGTKGVDTAEKSGVSKYLNYGIVIAKINGIAVEKARSTDSKRIVFSLEGAPVDDKSFVGVDGAKGPVGKMSTNYMNSDKSYQDFMRQIGVIADKLGLRPQIDSISGSTIEEYIGKVAQLFVGKPLCWNIGGEEYTEGKFALKLQRYSFVKSLTEVDLSSLTYDGYVVVDIKDHAGASAMHFDKANKYHFTPYVQPDAGFELPGATSFSSQPSSPNITSIATIPGWDSNAPAASGEFNTSDLPF